MIAWRAAQVSAITETWGSMVRLETVTQPDAGVGCDVGSGAGGRTGELIPALADTAVVGPIEVGAHVLLNVTSWAQGLGTGGYALVVARTDRLPHDAPGLLERTHGHLVKARYAPTQVTVTAVEEQSSQHHALLAQEGLTLAGLPVLVAPLHSQIPALIAGIRMGQPDARIAYVMSDHASLPLGLSRLVHDLVAADWVHCTVTTGQAYGGQLEAISIASGLLAAAHVGHASHIVLGPGPGTAGTGTPWGHSGVGMADCAHQAAAVGGTVTLTPRVSGADQRPRHQSLSHHTATLLRSALFAPATLIVPSSSDDQGAWWDAVAADAQAAAAAGPGAVRVAREALTPVLQAALESTPSPLRSMGRDLDQEPRLFEAAVAAGSWGANRTPGT